MSGKAKDGGGFTNARHAGDDDMWHIAIFGDDLETLYSFGVAHYIIKIDWPILLDPVSMSEGRVLGLDRSFTHHGKSYAAPAEAAGLALIPLFAAALEDSAFAITDIQVDCHR